MSIRPGVKILADFAKNLVEQEVPPAQTDVEAIYARLKAVSPVPVNEVELAREVRGRTNGRVIEIQARMSTSEKVETLLHEWAHVLLHASVRGALTERELEAAATGYVVGRELGLGMRETRGYVQAITRRIPEKPGGKPLWEADVDFLERILWAAQEMLSRIGALERPLRA